LSPVRGIVTPQRFYGHGCVSVLGSFAVNPIACGPPLAPSAHWPIDEHHDRSAFRAAILLDVLSVTVRLGVHV